jgi:hypothetical protein
MLHESLACLRRAFAPSMLFNPIAIELKHEHAKRRRQIDALALRVDLSDQTVNRYVAGGSGLFKSDPKGLFQTHAGVVAGDGDRPFADFRFK